MFKIKLGSRVRIRKEYKDYTWYSENIYCVNSISENGKVATLNENLVNSKGAKYSNEIKISLLFDVTEDRKNKLIQIKNKII